MFTLLDCFAGLLFLLAGLQGTAHPAQGVLEDTLSMLGSEVCLPHLQPPPLSELTHTQQFANITYYTHLWLGTAWSFHASLCESWHLALFYQQQVAPALRNVSLLA